MVNVATRASRLDDAKATTRQARLELGREIRRARMAAGASLTETGRRVAMSHAQLSRIERGVLAELTVDQLSRACAAVGLRLMVRAVPGAGPALDRGQLALLGRLRALLPAGIRVRTEVPLPLVGDARAWDAILELDGGATPVEAETRLSDVQALDRRHALKRRDAGVDRMILLVSDSANNRSLLGAYREDLRSSFPLDGRAILPALRAGRAPAASGIIVL